MTNSEKLRALADWFDGYDFSSKGFLNHNEVQQDLRAMANEFEQLQQHGVSGKQPNQFSTEAVIESIKTLWVKDFGRLDSNSPDRDGYFVCGFVHAALKAARANGGEAQSQSDGIERKSSEGAL